VIAPPSENHPAAVRAMLEPQRVAVIGASERPGSFGDRLVTQLTRSTAALDIHLVNPRYDTVHGLECVPTLDAVDGAVDLVLMGVPDAAVEAQLELAAGRGDRSAVLYGSLFDGEPPAGGGLRSRVGSIARSAGMALCGGGCMGFVNLSAGVRAVGYVERDTLRRGPVAFISHSGSVFSAILRTRRHLGFTLVVSAGQELVTTAASYLEYVLDAGETRVVGLLLETLRDPDLMRAGFARAAEHDVAVVALTVGGSEAGRAMVATHSGALAGADGAWEALFDAYGVIRVRDLDELTDTIELFASGRTAPAGGRGIATVHDSGAERALVADVAEAVGVPFAPLSDSTNRRLRTLLDPGLVPGNPLDVWGTGADTEQLFRGCLLAMAEDEAVSAVALAVDLVEEYDGDESYPNAVIAAAAATPKPVVVLSNLGSALDLEAAGRIRAAGVPVLEGTRSGLGALRHLLRFPHRRTSGAPSPDLDPARRRQWRTRLAHGPLTAIDSFALLEAYGIASPRSQQVSSPDEAAAAARAIGVPVVMKTDSPTISHKSDVRGVVLGVATPAAAASAYRDLATRLGPRVVVSATAPEGVELALGVVRDPVLGPLVVLGAGGVHVEVLADRVVRLAPLDEEQALEGLARLRASVLLDGVRGEEPSDRNAVARAVVAVSHLAVDLYDTLHALDVNPLRCGPWGCMALDVLLQAGRDGADS
jgi:acetate---CoA ligase (ADP-forming)